MVLVGIPPKMLAEIRRFEKNLSAYVRKALTNQLKRDLKKLDKPKD
jgi:hypothetical protein